MRSLPGLLADRVWLARVLFSIDAVLGILVAGAAALSGAAWTSANPRQVFVAILIPLAIIWIAVCYGAYKGVTTRRPVLLAVFWVCVIVNLPTFPIGTAIAGASVWLWRELKPGTGSARLR